MAENTRYTFEANDTCRMCGAGADAHSVIGQRLNRSQKLRPHRLTGFSVTIQKCGRCGLVSPNPLPVPASLADHYGLPPEQYWTAAAVEYDGVMLEQEVRIARQLVGGAGGRALDIGAGLGKVLRTLETFGFEAHGLEPSQPFYDFALAHSSLGPERLKLATVEEAEYPPGHFDFITFGAVLEHLYDPGAAIERAMEWLRPGGIVHIDVPSSRYLMARLTNIAFRLIGTRFVTNVSPMHSPFHIFEFDIQSFRRHAERAGYEVVRQESLVGSIYHLPRMLHPPLKALMRATGTGMQLIVYLRKRAPVASVRSEGRHADSARRQVFKRN